MKQFLRVLCLFLLSFVLAACFGNGDGGGTTTYTVGGTVTGLEGTGLVLQNNDGDDIAISADGSFTFVTALANGSDYSITVLTQPSSPNQTCSVTNGSGTLSGSNITNVSVTCVTNTYTVGGAVTGLSGSGLVLQNNGGGNLSIITSSSFTFASAIADGSSYSVTVQSQPTSPSQICTVNNGSGTLTGSNITNVTVMCTTNTYSIGGTISGLTGTGLVLQNNSINDLSISTDGVFTFTTAIADGNGYSITVLTQPTGQTCMASNASGTVTGADVSNVAITCSRVSPLYGANGFDWNDYVQGNDITDATDTACFADTDTACLHGGEIRMVELASEASCTGITASDALGVFDWICDNSTGTPRVISSGLASGYGLVDLLDFATPGWKENSLTIYKDVAAIETTTAAVWWSNPVLTNTTGGALDASGTVYVVPSSTVATAYDITASKVSLVAASGVTISGPAAGSSSYVISAISMDFLWLEGMAIDATGDDIGVYWDNVRFSMMRDIISEHAHIGSYRSGVLLRSSSYNFVSNITANNNDMGINLTSATNNTLSNLTTSSNDYMGVILNGSSNNLLTDLATRNNIYDGLRLNASSSNAFSDLTVTNNSSYGIFLVASLSDNPNNNSFSRVTLSNNSTGLALENASDNTFSDLVANNNGRGVVIESSSSNTLIGVTTSNNSSGIFLTESSNNNTLTDVTASNNSIGILLWSTTGPTPSNNTFSNVTASNNNTGVTLSTSSENYFTGELKVGSNASEDCSVSGGINLGLVDGTCANNGASDATLTTGVTITGSFIAKVTIDDSLNTSDTDGVATITDAFSFDWVNFENRYRAWGVEGNAFPDATNRGELGCSDTTYTNQTDCEANSFIWIGDARIWDWSLLTTDTVIKDALSLPTGNDTLTHTWSDASTSIILRNAVEIMDDGMGNDNSLCETGETCLYTPNMGSYQGHGNLMGAGSIGAGGTLENITLMKYETNGY